MTWTLDDIIAAVASPPGPGPRGIVRASGPSVQSLLQNSFDCESDSKWFEARRAARFGGWLDVAGLNTPLPADVWFWPDHRSYTGWPTMEIHTIGSPPVLDAIVQDLVRRGARVARPGEFTLRAFLAGKIDLVQAEAVLGVIDADDTDRLHLALNQLSGGISSRMRSLREELLMDLADLEAGLDFVDEDIEFVDRSAMSERLQHAANWLDQLQKHAASRGQTSGRRQVVLAGLPNAGKSTLFNALVDKDAAVVSSQAGTTRDWLVAPLKLDGISADLIDTAGVDAAANPISLQAQAAREECGRHADLILWCSACDAVPTESSHDELLFHEAAAVNRTTLRVWTKSDRVNARLTGSPSVSAKTGDGLDELLRRIHEMLVTSDGERSELLSSTLARCQSSLETASAALRIAQELSAKRAGEELVAFELRRGLDALGEIAGVIYTDDLLDRIFSRFCIGK